MAKTIYEKSNEITSVTLSVSLHTSGFYKRIGDLKEKLGN